MLREIFGSFGDMFAEVRHGTPTRTIMVSKPYCSPARDIITSTFQRYGVKIIRLSERAQVIGLNAILQQYKLPDNTFDADMPKALPLAQVAQVTVSEKQVAWAEYLLLRTGKLHIVGKYQNKRNETWAKQHGGRMPPAWQDGKPWIETSCKKGMDQWRQIREASRKRG